MILVPLDAGAYSHVHPVASREVPRASDVAAGWRPVAGSHSEMEIDKLALGELLFAIASCPRWCRIAVVAKGTDRFPIARSLRVYNSGGCLTGSWVQQRRRHSLRRTRVACTGTTPAAVPWSGPPAHLVAAHDA